MIFLGEANSGPVFAQPESNLLVLGPPRSGKTTSVIIPNLLLHQGPAVVTSTKSDVLRATLSRRTQLGPVYLFDPTGSVVAPVGVIPVRWSPVVAAPTLESAIAVADNIVDVALGRGYGEGSHWAERAKAMLAPVLLAVNLSGGDMRDVVGGIDERDLLRFGDSLERNSELRALQILSGLHQTETRELSGIFSTCSGALAAYRSRVAVESSVKPNFSAKEFLDAKGTLFIISSSSAQRTVAPVIVSMLDQIRIERYRRSQEASDSGDGPLLLALDELANIAPIPDLASILSEGVSQGVTTIGCLQDLSQARSRWGSASSGFLTLFGTTLLLPGVADSMTLGAISEVSGTRMVRESQHSFDTTISLRRRSTISVRLVERKVLTQGELSQIPMGSALVFDWRSPPGSVSLKPFRAREAGL